MTVLIIVFISTYKYQIKKEMYEKRKELHTRLLNTFFAKAIKKGHTKEDIKKMLLNKLWPEDIVAQYCNKVFKDVEEKIKSLKK